MGIDWTFIIGLVLLWLGFNIRLINMDDIDKDQ